MAYQQDSCLCLELLFKPLVYEWHVEVKTWTVHTRQTFTTVIMQFHTISFTSHYNIIVQQFELGYLDDQAVSNTYVCMYVCF